MMILLPDEEGKPVAAQVREVIGAALRESVGGVEPTPEFSARLAAALDGAAAESAAESAAAVARAGQRAAEVKGGTGGAGPGSEAVEAAS